MRARALTVGLALFAAVAVAQYPTNRYFEQPNLSRFISNAIAAYSGAWFEFAPTLDGGSLGLDTAVPLCTALQASEKTGNWWCLNGDGTMANGSTETLSLAGTTPAIVLESGTVTPNGPNGGTEPWIRGMATATTTGPQFYQSGTTTSLPAGAWSECAVYSHVSSAPSQNIIMGHGAKQYLQNTGAGSTQVNWGINNIASSATTTGVSGAIHISCATVSAGGTANYYIDGALLSGPASPGRDAATAQWKVGCYDSTSVFCLSKGNRIFGAFVTEVEFTPTRIATLAHAVLADQPRGITSDGDAGVVETLVRATPLNCAQTSALAGSVIPSGRECVANGAAPTESAFTEDALRTSELSNVAWTCGEAATADTTVSPWGTLTADTLQDTSGAAQRCCTQSITTGSLTKHAVSVRLKAGTLAAAQVKITGTGNSAGDCTASTTGLNATWQRVSCVSPSAYAAGLTAVTVSVCSGTVVGDTGTIIASTANHWVSANYPPSETEAAGATQAQNAMVHSFAGPALSGSTIDAAVTWNAPSAITSSGAMFHIYKDASNSLEAQLDAASHLVCTFRIAGSNSTVTSVATVTASAANRMRCYYDGTNRAACVGGVCATTSGALTLPTGAHTTYLGSDQAGANQPGGSMQSLCTNLAVGGCV